MFLTTTFTEGLHKPACRRQGTQRVLSRSQSLPITLSPCAIAPTLMGVAQSNYVRQVNGLPISLPPHLTSPSQYIKPKCHNGMVFKKPRSISSLTIYPFSEVLICLLPLFLPPISKSKLSILKSVVDEVTTLCRSLS